MVEKVIRLSDIVKNPYQTRILSDEEEDAVLRKSILASGMHVKPIVRPHPSASGKYMVVDGQRRVNVAAALGWTEIEVQVVDFSDKEAAEATLNTNLQRRGLNPVEEAQGYRLLVEFGHTEQMVADQYGKSRSHIANRLRLLEMPFFLKMGVLCKTLSPWQASTIMMLLKGYRRWRLGSLAMDWFLTQSELRSIVESVKGGEVFVSWQRMVPVAGLWWADRRGSGSGELKMDFDQSGPVACYPDGYVMEGHEMVKRARADGVEQLTVEVFFEVQWLLENSSLPSVPVDAKYIDDSMPRIIPRLSAEQEKNMKLFLNMLKGREKDYPVLSVVHMDVSDLPEAKPVVGGTSPIRRAKAIFLELLPHRSVGMVCEK
jgi:ParB/RepB/Spo0J family partition protein